MQKLAVTASFWIAAITVSELLLNPILYMVTPEESRAEAQIAALEAFAAQAIESTVRVCEVDRVGAQRLGDGDSGERLTPHIRGDSPDDLDEACGAPPREKPPSP